MKIVKDIFNEKLKDSKLVTDEEAEQAFTSIIKWLGEDPEREGLKSTPKRLVKAYKEYFKGYKEDPKKFLQKTFGDVQGYDEIGGRILQSILGFLHNRYSCNPRLHCAGTGSVHLCEHCRPIVCPVLPCI